MIHKNKAALQVASPKNPLQYKRNKNIMKEIEEFINDPDAYKCGTPGHFIKTLEFLENECPKTTSAQKQHYYTIVLKILSTTNDYMKILLENSTRLKKRVKDIVASSNEIHKEFEGCLVELFELGNGTWRSRSLIMSEEPKKIKQVLDNLIDVCDQISNMPQSITNNNSSYFDAIYLPKLQIDADQYKKQLLKLKNIEYR